MRLSPSLTEARALLDTLTPLKSDCGRQCSHACCQPQTEAEQGMLLFPGEAEYYLDRPGWRVIPCAQGSLLVCGGRCDRAKRPLSCRLFPLLPLVREGRIVPAMDRRGRAVCPLTRMGKAALDPAFVDAVRKAGEILCADETQRAFLQMLTCEQDEWKRLSQALGAER